jgi:hypothetical protein
MVGEIKSGEETTTDKRVEEAMVQIKVKKYSEKYASSDVSLVKIGFGKKERGYESLEFQAESP